MKNNIRKHVKRRKFWENFGSNQADTQAMHNSNKLQVKKVQSSKYKGQTAYEQNQISETFQKKKKSTHGGPRQTNF